ncbi:MAG TPA: T9SS type A sorting domain-containing protein, partial [Bacteroidia bacterium]
LPNSITYLDCDNSQLFSFTNLPTSLTTLICNDNEISNLPTLPNSLTYLNCKSFNNNATLLSFPNFPNSLTWLDCSYNEIKCFPTFPNSITSLNINFNNYNCLPNYISAMGSDTVTYPLCAAGNSNGCAVTAGIEQYSANTNISIYPNPSNGSFVIEPNSTTKQTMQVYDVNGKMVLSQTINGKTTIDATPLNEGVYNISLLSNEGMVNKRVVIVR